MTLDEREVKRRREVGTKATTNTIAKREAPDEPTDPFRKCSLRHTFSQPQPMDGKSRVLAARYGLVGEIRGIGAKILNGDASFSVSVWLLVLVAGRPLQFIMTTTVHDN